MTDRAVFLLTWPVYRLLLVVIGVLVPVVRWLGAPKPLARLGHLSLWGFLLDALVGRLLALR